jgi:glycosyltransferase involved in cell wall biosynthesis
LAQGLPAERIVAIANGIRTEPFANAGAIDFAARNPAIVMVARLSKQKDHATLLRALALLADRGLRPELHLAGGGKKMHLTPLQVLAQSLGVQNQVKFLGVIRHVPDLLMHTQISVLSTHHEGMPLALIEGMAAGCAVIGSDVPGVREIISDGADGLLVKAKDPSALADALERLLRDPGLAQMLGSAGREKALREFSRERMNQGYERLLMQIAGRESAGFDFGW